MIRTLYFGLVKYNIAVLSNKAFTIYFIYLSRNYESGIVGFTSSQNIKENGFMIKSSIEI